MGRNSFQIIWGESHVDHDEKHDDKTLLVLLLSQAQAQECAFFGVWFLSSGKAHLPLIAFHELSPKEVECGKS